MTFTANIQKQGLCSDLTYQRAAFWQESYYNVRRCNNDVRGTIAFSYSNKRVLEIKKNSNWSNKV